MMIGMMLQNLAPKFLRLGFRKENIMMNYIRKFAICGAALLFAGHSVFAGALGWVINSSKDIPQAIEQKGRGCHFTPINWGPKEKRRFNSICTIFKMVDDWHEFSYSFTPEADGQVTLSLASNKRDGEDRWVEYAGISVEGATLRNGDFKQLSEDGKKLLDWQDKGYILIKDGDGVNSVKVYHDKRAVQTVTVTAGQTVTVSGKIRKPGGGGETSKVEQKEVEALLQKENPSVKNIQRTMRSLNGERNPGEKVRILFYGQSITAQQWWKKVVSQLKTDFPKANIEVANPAIGGFKSHALIRTAYHDLYPFYPDLLIFHVYGDMKNYEAIIKKARETTTAEIILWTDHVAVRKHRGISDDQRSETIRELAKKYDCMLIDVRPVWKKYLADSGKTPKDLLSDTIHLNSDGVNLLAEIIGNEIKRNDTFGENAKAQKQITTIPIDSDQVKKNSDGSISLDFTGNRVVAVSNGENPTRTFKVMLDGKELNTFSGVWGVTLPSSGINWMPSIRRVEVGENPVAETWTLTCLDDSTPDGKKIHFKLTGSVTGEDGEGWSTEDFVSKSGRIKIAKRDWGVAGTLRVARKKLQKNFEITWKTYSLFKSSFSPGSKGEETLLLQGVSNSEHNLTIIPEDAGSDLGISTFRMYQP
jgi:hypothetical protein